MANSEELKKLCYDDKGDVRTKSECRAVLINHLILDEMMDIDEAEDLAEKTLQEVNLWKDEDKQEPLPPDPAAANQ
ncbi:MAG: hypothetical protein PHC70_05395 [Patescibacteria group bacterium]|nr:hypothetical protein [Patescibacteria group bacterium]